MTIALGVDTGGTYTDAVLIRDEEVVLAEAKALTTRGDLAVGIGAAIRSVLEGSGVKPEQIGMASLSTTLATNALVEGQGGRVALIFIGFAEKDLAAQGLEAALAGDPVLVLAGGHGYDGAEVAPLDLPALDAFLSTYGDAVDGFAVCGRFAVRNPAHEKRVAARVTERTDRPVSASHQLSAKLGGPKRALTAVLNARLIGMIDRLIDRAEAVLRDIGIDAPLMVVRGDGALISASSARTVPIETILSGPAASIVGASWLAGADTALVSDIGGTTTDIAVLRDGRPALDPLGAQVGSHRTMVEAVSMRTFGLGGDSEVHMAREGLAGGLWLGPRRLLPISLIATEAPDVVLPALDKQNARAVPSEYDARFVRAMPGAENAAGLGAREEALLMRIAQAGVQPLSAVLENRLAQSALSRLVARALVQVSGVTPSDAAHVLGYLDSWDTGAARIALGLMARRRIGTGDMLADGPEALARMIEAQLVRQTGLALLESAFAEDTGDFGGSPPDLADHGLMRAGLAGHRGLVRIEAGLAVPVIGVGASASTYYPAVGKAMGTTMHLPKHAGVANAIGAVVGQIRVRREGAVTSPSEGLYLAHLPDGPERFSDAEAAMLRLEAALCAEAEASAGASGATDLRTETARDLRVAEVEARRVFVEAQITVEVTGRPRIT